MYISYCYRLEFYGVENIHISGVTFQGCRNGVAIQIITATSTATIGSLFIRNSAGIRMTGVTRAIVMRSNFTQNNGNSFQASHSVVMFDKSNFYNNGYRYITSNAIYVSYSNISIKDSRFNNNDGIGINAQYTNVTIDSTEFNYNDGGAISSTYQSSNFQINDTIFYGDRAYDGSGGAIYLYGYGSGTDSPAHIQIYNTAFYFNTVRHQGGAISYNFMAKVTGTRASFNLNYITQPFTATWLNTAMEEQYTSMHNPACIITIIGGNCQ